MDDFESFERVPLFQNNSIDQQAIPGGNATNVRVNIAGEAANRFLDNYGILIPVVAQGIRLGFLVWILSSYPYVECDVPLYSMLTLSNNNPNSPL